MAIEIPRAEKAPQEGFFHEGEDGGAAKVLRREWALRRLPRWGRGVRRRAAPLRTVTPLRDIPVLRMAYFLQTAHCAVCRKTHMLQVRCAQPTGVFAPEHPFGMFRCFAWLIKIREHTVLSYLKRSCFRFAALTLRLRTVTPLRDIPVFRSAYFTQRVHSTLCSKTLDLQVRCAHPAGTGELRIPPPPFTAGAGTSEKEMRWKTEGRSAEKLLK